MTLHNPETNTQALPTSKTCTLFFLKEVVCRVFFHRISTMGIEHIPPPGKATLFVSNHSNQFLDFALLSSIIPFAKKVAPVIAFKSIKRPVIGSLARLVGAIPVYRGLDFAYDGLGLVYISSNTCISTEHAFCNVNAGDRIVLVDFDVSMSKAANANELKVIEKINDSTCRISNHMEESYNDTKKYRFRVIPKIDNSQVFVSAVSVLMNRDSILIYPEGGSHDRKGQLLPFKPGMAIMCIDALSKGCDEIHIVPVFCSYYEPYKFRSSVVVEFGPAFVISKESDVVSKLFTSEEFMSGVNSRELSQSSCYKEVVSNLTDITAAMVKNLLLPAESYEDFQVIRLSRLLYTTPISGVVSQMITGSPFIKNSLNSENENIKESTEMTSDNMCSVCSTISSSPVKDSNVCINELGDYLRTKNMLHRKFAKWVALRGAGGRYSSKLYDDIMEYFLILKAHGLKDRHILKARNILEMRQNDNPSTPRSRISVSSKIELKKSKSIDERLSEDVLTSMLVIRSSVPAAILLCCRLCIAPLIALIAIILFSPVGILCWYCALKEKKKALANSMVKVKGLDVVGSYKALVALLVMPIYNLLLAVVVIRSLKIIQEFLTGLPTNDTFRTIAWQYSLMYWLILPIAEYMSILISDYVAINLLDFIAQWRLHRAGETQLINLRDSLLLRVHDAVDGYSENVDELFKEFRQNSQQKLLVEQFEDGEIHK